VSGTGRFGRAVLGSALGAAVPMIIGRLAYSGRTCTVSSSGSLCGGAMLLGISSAACGGAQDFFGAYAPGVYPPGTVRLEMAMRFHALMAATASVRSASSFSEKWGFTAS